MKILFVPGEHISDGDGIVFSDVFALKKYLADLYCVKPAQLNFCLSYHDADHSRAIESGFLFAGDIYLSSDFSCLGSWTVVPDLYQFPRLRKMLGNTV